MVPDAVLVGGSAAALYAGHRSRSNGSRADFLAGHGCLRQSGGERQELPVKLVMILTLNARLNLIT
jgi:hypothetical protein